MKQTTLITICCVVTNVLITLRHWRVISFHHPVTGEHQEHDLHHLGNLWSPLLHINDRKWLSRSGWPTLGEVITAVCYRVQTFLNTNPTTLKYFACTHLHVCTPQWWKAEKDFVSPQFEHDETLHQTRDVRRDAEMQNTIFISNFPSDFRQRTIMSTYAVDQHTDVKQLVPCLCVGTNLRCLFPWSTAQV